MEIAQPSGYEDKLKHEIHIESKMVSDTLTIIISDDGIPFNPLEKEDPDIAAPLEERDIGGLGVYIVKNLF